jgi:hypothetical protein
VTPSPGAAARRTSRAAALALATGACAAGAAGAQTVPTADTVAVRLAPDTAGAGLLAAAARTSRVVRVRGGGVAVRVLREALARPHVLVVAPDTGLTLGRDVRADRPLVVIGGPLRIAATVPGDVVVVGELFLRPGADVDGRAVALGGGAYNSTLARVRGGLFAYRDVGFDAAPDAAGGLVLDARSVAGPTVARFGLPGTGGFRLPAYDRVNGVSLSFGPELALDTGRVRIDPLATYRSQLGVVDVALGATAELARRTTVELRAARGTFTNDAWARTDLVNTIVFAGTGADARNYYRADRFDLTVARRVETPAIFVEPLVGVLVERAWSAARDSASSRPFTVFGRDDPRQGARRPNPSVSGGRITSAVVGARARRETGGVRGRAEARVEQALAVQRGDRFTRAVLDVAFERGESGERQALFFAHAALTAGRRVPTQRYAYLGGGPTLPTLFLLEQGGTELVWGEARYVIPVPRVRIPFGGAPSVTLRAMTGAAGVGTLPALTPNLGLRLTLAALRADLVVDPTGRSRGPQLSLGVGLR